MKKSILIVSITAGILAYSCGDRKTNSDNEVKLEEREEPVAQGEDMFPAGDEVSASDMAEINSAKKVINDYFDALNRGDVGEAYEAMSQSSDRGTSSDFAEKNAEIETVTVSFTEDPEVVAGNSGTDVNLPLRYTIQTKDGNTKTFTGRAMIVKGNAEDSEYKIQGMNVTREDS